MPLLIPGLDEVATKKLAKRLRKSLVEHPGVPSLTQLQTLLVQAAGHADWYAAQGHWEAQKARERGQPRVEPTHFDEPFPRDPNLVLEEQVVKEIARRQVEAAMTRVLRDLEYSYNAANRAMGSMDSLRDGLDALEGPAASMNAYPALKLVRRLQDLARKADNPQIFEDPTEALDRMKSLTAQLEKRFQSLFGTPKPKQKTATPKS